MALLIIIFPQMTINLKCSSFNPHGTNLPGGITALVRLGAYYPRVAFNTKFSVPVFSIKLEK